MTLTVYGTIRSRTLRPLWLLAELGQPFELVPVNWADKASKTPDFLTVNPNGRVPALKDGDLMLFESFAITQYLAKKFPSDLSPKDLAEDALISMWSLWAATEIEKPCVEALGLLLTPAENRDTAKLAKIIAALDAPFKVLDAHLKAHGGYLVGGRFTVADLNVSSVLSWLRTAPEALEGKPALTAWRDECLKRPAFKAAIRG
jgi:glutathione S-transferase